MTAQFYERLIYKGKRFGMTTQPLNGYVIGKRIEDNTENCIEQINLPSHIKPTPKSKKSFWKRFFDRN